MNEVKTAVDNFIESMMLKYKLAPDSFDEWKVKVFKKLSDKIKTLKSSGRPKETKPILRDDDVLEYLAELHNNFVIVPIDKADNNISIICKRFYVTRLLKEIGALGDLDPTYEIQNISA